MWPAGSLTSAEVIAELIEMAKEVAAEAKRFSPPLSESELAFYDAVSTNESAVARFRRLRAWSGTAGAVQDSALHRASRS